jgi:hypothetical protein
MKMSTITDKKLISMKIDLFEIESSLLFIIQETFTLVILAD